MNKARAIPDDPGGLMVLPALAEPAEVGGLGGSSAALLAGSLAVQRRAVVLAVVRGEEEAERFAEDIGTLTGIGAEVVWEVPDAGHLSVERASARVEQARRLSEPGPRVWVASVRAAMQGWPEPEALRRDGLVLEVGAAVVHAHVVKRLASAGLERLARVEAPGQFAVRGGLIDVWPLGQTAPLRVEFDGDVIDSIRMFDPATQASVAACRRVEAAAIPAAEVVRQAAASGQGTLRQRLAGCVTLLVDLEDPPAELRRGAWILTALPGGGSNVPVGSLERFSGRLTQVALEMRELATRCQRVVVYCVTAAEEERLRAILREGGVDPDRFEFRRGRLHAGFVWGGVAHVPHAQIFQRRTLVRRAACAAAPQWDSFLEIEPGDFVVHVDHGIGRFRGFVMLPREGGAQEFAQVEYADRTLLYVPVAELDRLQKYLGGTDEAPALSRIGTEGWSETKRRARDAALELARDLVRVQAQRVAAPGIAYPPDGQWQEAFEAAFAYEETPDQIDAAEVIRSDMQAPRPMDRLLCGDVGYGKTEIAMRAAFRAVAAGRQVAVLVPTTVLAEQHARTFRERMAEYPVVIEVVSRFLSRARQRATLERTARGEVDILIGTHRLLQPDVRFRDLGLVIIDEEQRFGVEHKERLKHLRTNVDVLTLTATPIPRTLHMALLGLRDITSLATPPSDRRAIHTEVVPYEEERIRQAIEFELARGGQVFYVSNRVETIDAVATGVQRLVPDAAVAVAHGQMDEEALEEVMLEFLDRRVDVLVATTIIESGLDIPTANTIIVQDADMFGLADLHQLRGRVGRWRHQAYASFLLPRDRPITPTGYRRLKAIEEFSELGAGFKIALRDLEIRGAGNLLGREQSGHIAAVGYELYCRLLESAVAELRTGRRPLERVEPQLELPGVVGVPDSYVPDLPARLEVYREATRARTDEEIERARRRIEDRFGRLPPQTEGLLRRVRIRRHAEKMGIARIAFGEGHLEIRVAEPRAGALLRRRGARLVDGDLWVAPADGDPVTAVERLVGIRS